MDSNEKIKSQGKLIENYLNLTHQILPYETLQSNRTILFRKILLSSPSLHHYFKLYWLLGSLLYY